MSTGKKGSHGLRVLLNWVRSLGLHRTLQDVMFVFAEHSDYWDGRNSRPGIPTIAKKARVSERHARRLVHELEEAGHLILAREARGTLPATYNLNVILPISATSTVSTGEKSTDSLGVTSSAARGDISATLGVTSGEARGDISAHAIRKTVLKHRLSTTVKAPASAGAAADKDPWENLVPGLRGKVLTQMKLMVSAAVGGSWNDNPSPEQTRARWLEACDRAGIWPNVAQQVADHFYIQAGGRIEPDHSPAAFRSPRKKAAGGDQ